MSEVNPLLIRYVRYKNVTQCLKSLVVEPVHCRECNMSLTHYIVWCNTVKNVWDKRKRDKASRHLGYGLWECHCLLAGEGTMHQVPRGFLESKTVKEVASRG